MRTQLGRCLRCDRSSERFFVSSDFTPRCVCYRLSLSCHHVAVVWRGVCRGEPVAVKIIKTNGPVDEETLAAFRREVEILSRVFSPVRTLSARRSSLHDCLLFRR